MNNPHSKELQDIESSLWNHNYLVSQYISEAYEYDDKTFRATLKIFIEAMIYKITEHQAKLNLSEEDRLDLGRQFGSEITEMVLKYSGIATYKLYEKEL